MPSVKRLVNRVARHTLAYGDLGDVDALEVAKHEDPLLFLGEFLEQALERQPFLDFCEAAGSRCVDSSRVSGSRRAARCSLIVQPIT